MDDDMEVNFFSGGDSNEADAVAAMFGGSSSSSSSAGASASAPAKGKPSVPEREAAEKDITKGTKRSREERPRSATATAAATSLNKLSASASTSSSSATARIRTKAPIAIDESRFKLNSKSTASSRPISTSAAAASGSGSGTAAKGLKRDRPVIEFNRTDEEEDDEERDRVNDLRPTNSKSGAHAAPAPAQRAEVTKSRAQVQSEEDEFADHMQEEDQEDGNNEEFILKSGPAAAAAASKAASSGPKHRSLTLREDPQQFHAKPKDLDSKDMQSTVAVNVNVNAQSADYIFSKMPFAALGLDERLVEVLGRGISSGGMGLKTSTLVQSTVVPLLTQPHLQASMTTNRPSNDEGEDNTKPCRNILFKSETGSGKTIAFLLPILHGLLSMPQTVTREEGTRAIIISPTRELCAQITQVLSKLTSVCVNLVGGSIVGGEKKKSEKARLRKGVVILVATPGRLLDHMRTTECFKLQQLRYLVLDEADRLLDMGFENSLLSIVALLRGQLEPSNEKSSKGSDKKSPKSTVMKESNRNNSGKAMTLEKKWNAQQASALKMVLKPNKLIHLMASATITHALKRLAMPIMGGEKFFFVDADNKSIDVISTIADLQTVGQKKNTTKAGTEDDLGAEGGSDSVPAQNRKEGGSQLAAAEAMDAPKQLQQFHMLVTCKWRLAALVSFLRTHSHQKIIVFFSTCDSADFHALLMRDAEWPLHLDVSSAEKGDEDGAGNNEDSEKRRRERIPSIAALDSQSTGLLGDNFPIYRLHGNVPQKNRQTIFAEFSAAQKGVLFCTDVAARGLDLPQIDWILQYDPPCETTDYVHRCGRTARKGKAGSALLFLLPSESDYTGLLASHGLITKGMSLQRLFTDMVTHLPASTKFKNAEEMAAVIIQRRLENTVDGCQPLLMASRQAFRSHIRAYTTHSSESKAIFKVAALHLGHVARSFGLRESPKMLKTTEDVLGRIANSHYAPKVDRMVMPGDDVQQDSKATRLAKKRIRNEKYSLSRGGKSGSSSGGTGTGTGRSSVAGQVAEAAAHIYEELSVRDRKKQKIKHVVSNAREKQKLRPISSGGAARNRPGAIATKKRFKEQTTSEFAQ